MAFVEEKITTISWQVVNNPTYLTDSVITELLPTYEVLADETVAYSFILNIIWTFKVFSKKRKIIEYISAQNFTVNYKTRKSLLSVLETILTMSYMNTMVEYEIKSKNMIAQKIALPSFHFEHVVLEEIISRITE